MNISRNRLSSSVVLLCACTLLVHATSAVLVSPVELCVAQLCGTAPLVSERCAAACQRWNGPVDDKRAPSPLQGVAGSRKRYSSFVRVGRRASAGDKRYSSFVRIGRAAAGALNDRLAEINRRS